jgi:hypothetical protein
MKNLVISIALAGFVTSISAKTDVMKEAPFVPEKMVFPETSEQTLIDNLKISDSKRRPAASIQVKAGQAQSLEQLMTELHSLKTSEQVEAYLVKLDANYDSYPANVQFYVASITPMKAFRGIFFRLRTLFENNSNFQHSQVLTFVKNLASKNHVYLPYQHVNAVFEYVASPYYAGPKLVAGMKSEAEVQVWQVNSLLPELTKTIQRLEKLTLKDPVIWDQRIVYGPKSFQDDLGRYKQIGEFEKNILISGLYSAVSKICVTRSYNVQNSILLSKDIGFLYGLDGFGLNAVDGVSAKKVAKVIRKPAFAATGTIMPDGAKWMKVALEASQKSFGRFKRAWNYSTNSRQNESFYVINTDYLNVNREKIEQNLEVVDRIMTSKGTESLRSAVTGEVIQINYKSFYTNPPKDLKAFLPVKFEENEQMTRTIAMSDKSTKPLTYRNYSFGRATGWNTSAFKTYFPHVNSSEDITMTLRVLSHAGGNWLGLN